MKYSETIEPLDNEDRRIFYQFFLWKQVLAYTIGVFGLIIGFLSSDDKLGISGFFILEISAMGIFFYYFLDFRIIIQRNQKLVIRGKIEKMWNNPDIEIYTFLLEGNTKKLRVTKSIYNRFSIQDYVALHGKIGKTNIYHRAKKITYKLKTS